MATHLLTGAGSGIGAALARMLTDRGDQLVLVARSGARARELEDAYAGAHGLVADLADPAAVLDLTLPDRIDSVVHAAGVVDLAPVAQATPEQWREQLDVNVIAPAMLTRACLPALRSSRGTVVFVNSGAGLTAHPTWGAYAASKHALKALADSLRGEEHEHGVRVTSVYPGRTASAMQEKVHAQEGKDYDPAEWITPETVAAAIASALDLGDDATVPDLTLRPR